MNSMFVKLIELVSTLLTVNKSRLVKHLIKHVKQKLSEPCLHYFWNNNYQKSDQRRADACVCELSKYCPSFWCHAYLLSMFLTELSCCNLALTRFFLDTYKQVHCQTVKTQMKNRILHISSGSALFTMMKQIFKTEKYHNLEISTCDP